MLRVAPALGRAFTSADEVSGQHKVVILSDGFWQRRFGGATDVVGKTMELNEETWEIVGVMPRGFAYPVASEQAVGDLRADPLSQRGQGQGQQPELQLTSRSRG